MLLFPGGIEATTQSVVPWLGGQMFATAKFDAARLMAAVPANGPLEVRVVARLKGNQFISGMDTVRIK
jgi:hypothetical protein